MNPAFFEGLLSQVDAHPILVDVGASGAPPAVWEAIAGHATYIGFDPDLREIHEDTSGHFRKSLIVNKAITGDPALDEVTVYLTRSPYCSSTLPPNQQTLDGYLYADLFAVENEITSPATTLDAVVRQLGLPGIDWLKLDTQGTDLRILDSLSAPLQARLLAVDVEPGLVDFYQGEDVFSELHRQLVRRGFWLSDLVVKGAVRMRRDSLRAVQTDDPSFSGEAVTAAVKRSPTWVEARYLRTVDWLGQNDSGRREYALLWVFSLLDGQVGFALDLALAYERRFGADQVARTMCQEPLHLVRRRASGLLPSLVKIAGRLIPARVRRRLVAMLANYLRN